MTDPGVAREEVPPGYKRTEVGVIPEEWQAVKLGHLANIVRGASPRPIDSPKWFDKYSSTGWLRISDVTAAGKYVAETAQSLSAAGIANSRFVKSGNLIMSICATVGRPVITRKDVCIHDGFVVFDNLRADNEYLYYALSNIEADWSKHGQTGSQMNLNTNLIRVTPIPLPSLPEQQAIAAALSDADGLIGALDVLIEKKRAIKQAAMQQLLTGKKRLPGFAGEWETKRLGDILKFQVGFPFSSKYFTSTEPGLRLVKNRDLKADDEIVYYNGPYLDDYLVRDADVIVGMDGDFIPCVWDRGEALLNQRVGRLRASSDLDVKFAYYFLHKPLKEIERVTSSTTVKHLSHGDVEDITGLIPGFPEQRAIAAVLSDMDAEIAALERRREKTKQIKQGMMQQLLTGRIRLVEPPEAAA